MGEERATALVVERRAALQNLIIPRSQVFAFQSFFFHFRGVGKNFGGICSRLLLRPFAFNGAQSAWHHGNVNHLHDSINVRLVRLGYAVMYLYSAEKNQHSWVRWVSSREEIGWYDLFLIV